MRADACANNHFMKLLLCTFVIWYQQENWLSLLNPGANLSKRAMKKLLLLISAPKVKVCEFHQMKGASFCQRDEFEFKSLI